MFEFGTAVSLKAFGDVGHNRNSGTPHLVAESKVVRKATLTCDAVNLSGQSTCFLPRNEVFEALDSSHNDRPLALEQATGRSVAVSPTHFAPRTAHLSYFLPNTPAT